MILRGRRRTRDLDDGTREHYVTGVKHGRETATNPAFR